MIDLIAFHLPLLLFLLFFMSFPSPDLGGTHLAFDLLLPMFIRLGTGLNWCWGWLQYLLS